MENKELIGKKVKGFKFDDEKYRCGYSSLMDNNIGIVGTIQEYEKSENAYVVIFEKDKWSWSYPSELIEEHIVESNEMVEEPKEHNQFEFNPEQFEKEKQFIDYTGRGFPNETEIKTPDYYDNSKGSLYKIAEQRKWNAYIFDVVKRLDRGGKKDPLKQEIEKSIAVLQLWLKEME